MTERFGEDVEAVRAHVRGAPPRRRRRARGRRRRHGDDTRGARPRPRATTGTRPRPRDPDGGVGEQAARLAALPLTSAALPGSSRGARR